ncbi:MAG: lysophospholipid acyltransferase family protein [bacterium]
MTLHWWTGWLASYPAGALGLRLRVEGRRNLGPGPQIIASNHVTNVDPLVLGWAAARELNFLAKAELFEASRFFAWLIRGFNAWPVRRGGADRAALGTCHSILRAGRTLVLFPEGTRSPTGRLAAFKPGVGMLAIKNRAPVVPTAIVNLDRTWISYLADRDFVRRGLRRRPRRLLSVRVRFGAAVSPDGYGADRDGYLALAGEVENRVRELAGQDPGGAS